MIIKNNNYTTKQNKKKRIKTPAVETAGGENILIEKDIDTRIKMFRKKLNEELGNTNIEKIQKKKFWNPTNENPMRASEFLSFLDLAPFKKNLKKCTHVLKESKSQYMQEQNFICS